MENQGIIYKIKSIYIIKNISKYLKDNQKQKLFIYSKYFQNQLNIEYIDAKEKYLKNIGFDINEYLYKFLFLYLFLLFVYFQIFHILNFLVIFY